jgi:hypothetical protein
MTKDEALRLALEALELVIVDFVCKSAHHAKKDRHELFEPCPVVERYKQTITAIKEALKQEQDEPVALVAEVHISRYTIEWTNGPLPEGTKLYAKPQRKPLTDEHIDEIPFALFEQDQNGMSATEALREFARAIEFAHGIKE